MKVNCGKPNVSLALYHEVACSGVMASCTITLALHRLKGQNDGDES